MQSNQQYEQLMLQYQQLKDGAEYISKMIDDESYDDAITMIKNRESIFLNCKCMRKYLELNSVQQKELDEILEEIKTLEIANMKKLEKNMASVQKELKQTTQSQKFKNAYKSEDKFSGSLVNYEE